jgi:betaine-aldehyde dehydrogenase
MRAHDKLYIGGEWVPPKGTETLDVIHSATEEVIGRVPSASEEDAEAAIAAARGAFDAWSRTDVNERADKLAAIAEGLSARKDELAELIASEVGMPLKLALPIQAQGPAGTFKGYAKLVRDFPFETEVKNSVVIKEPVGVVGAITPWNFPLHQIAGKVAPALAAGCTVVLKPSEVAPLNAFLLAEVIDEVGLPPGVFNLVTGPGVPIGETLAAHPDVDMVSFTGSTRAGKRVAELAARTVKRVALELGGKSASVLLDDADFETAVKRTVSNCFLNSGQTCSAWTRMLVPKSKMSQAAELAKAAAERFTVGDPLGGEAKLGPLVSAAQRKRVQRYIEKGIDEGATLVTGGAEPPEGLDKGFYVRPTVFSDVDNSMTIAQEEIFGPVLCIIGYDDDAVRIANDSRYGLGGGVWSGDADHAKRVARRLRTGQIDINGARFNPLAPFGGYKQSGIGREFGTFGLEEFLEVKSMQL